MTLTRILLVVLLVVMLPVRGVMATAMPCASGQGDEDEGAAPAHAMHATHSLEAHHDAGGHHDDAPAGTGGGVHGCNLCSACCSVPPLPAAVPGIPQPPEHAAAGYPAIRVPAPTFESDGPERPPRNR